MLEPAQNEVCPCSSRGRYPASLMMARPGCASSVFPSIIRLAGHSRLAQRHVATLFDPFSSIF
jgi:hypothetical protein